ncbi:GIP, partial [Symbiodinium necroappetens]
MRRATAHTRPTGEATTVVEETSWSPTRAWTTTTANQGENEPLFTGGQVRRFRELEVQAPQLYGAVATTTGGASSETSGSYSKEQLELEVRRQVEAAMTSQRQLVDENQRLRQELEKVKASVRSGGGGVRAVEHMEKFEYQAAAAIQQDFQNTTVNKGVLPDYLVMFRYPAAIPLNLQVMMEEGLVTRPVYMEALKVILRDQRDVTMELVRGQAWSSSTTEVMMFKGKFEYPAAAIQQDFQNTTVSGIQNAVQNEGKRAEAVTAGDVAGGNSASPMEALLKGMSQLQQAMAIQVGLQTSRPEAIRPGVSGSELPKLPDADEFAAINVGDWLHGLAGPMGDLTDGSSTWWGCVIQSLEEYYKVFLSSTAVKKVQLRAEEFAVPTLADPRWSRVDKRAATMLLQAVPENIKSELLANRLSTTLSILARILTIYRPGSSVERQQVLKALESPGNGGGSAMELVEVLRKWSR